MFPLSQKTELKEASGKLENLIHEGHNVLSLLMLPVSCDNINNIQNNTVRPPTKTTSSPQVVFGQDRDLEMISKFLHDKSTNDKASRTNFYSVMVIHGIPGSGKTTLSQYVCEKEIDDDYFNLVMWIHVSEFQCGRYFH
jgi:Cdc6-like AAA superfamily ATPase